MCTGEHIPPRLESQITVLTPIPEQTVLAKRIHDLHHVSGNKCSTDKLSYLTSIFIADFCENLFRCPHCSQSSIGCSQGVWSFETSYDALHLAGCGRRIAVERYGLAGTSRVKSNEVVLTTSNYEVCLASNTCKEASAKLTRSAWIEKNAAFAWLLCCVDFYELQINCLV